MWLEAGCGERHISRGLCGRLAAAAQLRWSYAAIALGPTMVVTLMIRYIDLLRVRTVAGRKRWALLVVN